MEPSKVTVPSTIPLTSSIADVTQRLLMWARRSDSGLARVEYSSEFARQRVMQALKLSLEERSIPFHELVLPTHQTPEALVIYLLQALSRFDNGLVSISGFATAFSGQTALPDALRIVNFNRERFAAAPVKQIWWMTPAFLQATIHAMPDLSSWFIPRLQLTETVFAPEAALLSQQIAGSTSNIDDARQRSQHLIRQFEKARASGATTEELLTTYLLPALEALAEVGAQQKLRDLTSQFEGLLGQLQHTNSADLATSLDRLANLYHDQGRYSEAEPLYEKSLFLRRQKFGETHADVATSLNNLAELYRSQGRYAEAEPLHLQALELYQTLLGNVHADVATSLNNLAALYELQGRYEEAEPLYLKALELYQTLLGNAHPDVTASLNNLAELYRLQGRYEEAEPLYLKCIEIEKQTLAEDHPQFASSLNNLAHLYYFQGRYKEAEPLLLQALELKQRLLGNTHPDVATSLNNLAALYEFQERYKEAEPLYLQALELRQKVLDTAHPDVATSLNNLAGLYRSQGRYKEAEPLFLQALDILVDRLGENHPNTQTCWQNFRDLLQQATEAGQAAQLSDHPITQALLQEMQSKGEE